jgi:hypothetical protein
MVWAITGRFTTDDSSQAIAQSAEDGLKAIEEEASTIGGAEKAYVTAAAATMRASLRSLDTAYKGRQLNFEENEKLRAAYLESVAETLEFGTKASDFIKTLPTMTVSAAGGVTAAQIVGLSGGVLWAVGLALAALGYLVNVLAVRKARAKRQRLYVAQDYERSLYYDQYVTRVARILEGLLLDLERLHNRVFAQYFDAEHSPSVVTRMVGEVLAGVRPTFCPHVHKHIKEGNVTPELWALCETGDQGATHVCAHWPQ